MAKEERGECIKVVCVLGGWGGGGLHSNNEPNQYANQTSVKLGNSCKKAKASSKTLMRPTREQRQGRGVGVKTNKQKTNCQAKAPEPTVPLGKAAPSAGWPVAPDAA